METVKITFENGTVSPSPSELSNRQLWGLCLIPIDNQMPDNIRKYIGDAEAEFYGRKIKLVPLCS